MNDVLDDMKLSDTVIDAKTKMEAERYKADYKYAKANGDVSGMKEAQANYSALLDNY